ncbi:MAG: hypothetical protein KAU14_09110, partial [Thermoplasmata archaeon]|nr:hypothetical protein [Thermoplasmata archaeon]
MKKMIYRRLIRYSSILIMILMLIPQAPIVSATPERAGHPVDLYMYTEGEDDDVLKPVEPDTGTDTTKDCPNQNQQNTVTEISTWKIDIVGNLVMDGEDISFYVWAQNGDGVGDTTNRITILFELMKNTDDVLTSKNDTHIVHDDPVEFEMTTSELSFSMSSGDTLGFRLSYSWEDDDGTLPIAPPDDLQIVYGSTSHDASGNIPCDYVEFDGEDEDVREDDKEVDITASVNDAFGTDDLKDYIVEIEKNDHSYSAHQDHISGPNPTVNGNNVDLDWTWD